MIRAFLTAFAAFVADAFASSRELPPFRRATASDRREARRARVRRSPVPGVDTPHSAA